MGRVSGEVEEDVDPVVADLLGQPLVGPAENVPPVRRGGAESGRDVIRSRPVVLTDRRGLPAVKVLEKADDEVRDGVAA